MKKNAFKKATAVVLSASMVAGMAACGGNGNNANNTTTAAPQGTTASSNATTVAQAATEGTKEKATITFQTIDHEGSPLSGAHSEEVIKAMEDYTNTHVEFTWVANDVLEEKVSLALANPKEMPQIMAVGGVTGAIISAAEAGAFVDLNQYIYDSAKYPNLSQANKEVNKSLTIAGSLIGVYRARDIARNGFGYRTDWAEKLGLSEPKSIDDVYEMMYQFTYGDPDGNGANDTYGVALCKFTGPFNIMQTWFGVGNLWAEVNGKMTPVHMQPEYMEALDWFKKMYDDGLVYKDWAVRDTATWQDAVKNGECGMFIDVVDGIRRIWDYYANESIPSVSNPDEIASMSTISAINGKTLATSGFNGFFVLSASTCDTDEKIADCLNFLDKMNDPAMITLSGYGLKDIHWTTDEEGYLVDLDAEDKTASKAYMAMNQTVAYIPSLVQSEPPLNRNERQLVELAAKENGIPYAVFNPASSYTINSAEYALNGASLDQMIEDARTQYICGQIDKAGLEAVWATWLAAGGQRLIDEVNAQHAANR